MKRRSHLQVMAQLVGLVKPLTGYMMLAILMGLAGHLCAAFLTIFGAYGAVSLLSNVSSWLPWIFGGMVGMAILRGLLRYGEQACNHFIAFRLLALIRDQVFAALRRLAPAKLEGRDRGNLITLITSDVELLEVFYAHTISPFAIAVCFSGIMCWFLWSYHPALALVALAAYLTVGLLIPVVTARVGGEDGIRFRNQSGRLSSFVLDSLRGLPEILQYGAGARRLQEMGRRSQDLETEERRMKWVAGRNGACTNSVILCFDLLMLTTAFFLYQNQQVGQGALVISVVALMSSFGPVIALANLGATLQNTLAAGNRVLDLLEEAPVVEDVTGEAEVTFAGAKADQVTFSYEEEKILDGCSMEFPEGQIIGVVGRSGSGKSTLLKLFMRFWKAQGGELSISGRSLEHINTSELRTLESLVTQETHLFHDSIRNNLRIAKLDATEEEMIAACEKASIHKLIMELPQGYDTPVGELGDTLSGGERQRLGLARAFLHQSPLMLLDEPTSNLDSLNEAVILQALQKECMDKTVVLVSHRVSTMQVAQKVYSVDRGRVS